MTAHEVIEPLKMFEILYSLPRHGTATILLFTESLTFLQSGVIEGCYLYTWSTYVIDVSVKAVTSRVEAN